MGEGCHTNKTNVLIEYHRNYIDRFQPLRIITLVTAVIQALFHQ